ncbi:MAG: hypothetical protein ACRCW3_01715, partial [Metamycoplasmataceae bacterium]
LTLLTASHSDVVWLDCSIMPIAVFISDRPDLNCCCCFSVETLKAALAVEPSQSAVFEHCIFLD